ncbi:hypothetical protein SAURM35S_01397 [Streptomyces aurantiogriseus]
MHRRLYGRGALFDVEPAGLVPRLVGLRPYEHFAVKVEHPDEIPVVVLAGGRGLGKSAVLAEVWEAYTERNRRGEARRRTPVALVDCEDEQFARLPHAENPESWSPVWQALLVVAEQLTEPVKAAGQLTFPRLTAGLVAVRASDWSGRTDSERIQRELVRILLLNERASRFSMAGRWAARVAARVIGAGAASGQGPYVAAAVETLLEALSEGFTHHREQKPSQWYRTYPNAGGNARRGLLLLAGNFRAGGTSREHAERRLVRALLADLTEAYSGLGSHLRRLGRPIVLLDNARSGPGPGLLDAVLRDRAEGAADQVVCVATVRGTDLPLSLGSARAGGTPMALEDAVRRELPEVARATEWEPGSSPSSRALLVPLSPLSPDETLHMVGAACDDIEIPPQLPHATHRLTGGNPLGIVLLATAARQHPDQAASLGRLLTAGIRLEEGQADGPPAYGELLRRLVPADRLDELTVLAAAHDHDSAVALAAAHLPDDFGSSGVRSLRVRLAEEGLPAAPGHFVGDPFVRTLLLLRLHHRDADHSGWREVADERLDSCTSRATRRQGRPRPRSRTPRPAPVTNGSPRPQGERRRRHLRDTCRRPRHPHLAGHPLRSLALAPNFHGLASGTRSPSPRNSWVKRSTLASSPSRSRWNRIRPPPSTVYSATRSTSQAVTCPPPRPGRPTRPPSRGSRTSTGPNHPASPSAVATAGQTVSMGRGSRTRKCRIRVFPCVWLVPCSMEPVMTPA